MFDDGGNCLGGKGFCLMQQSHQRMGKGNLKMVVFLGIGQYGLLGDNLVV